MAKIYDKVYPGVVPLEPIHKGLAYQKELNVLRERGIRMKVVNVMEINQVISDKQKSLESDVNLYRNQDPLAAEVAQWGIELLNGVKDIISTKAFEATINQYKTGRNGV